jgi:hypothetical protein
MWCGLHLRKPNAMRWTRKYRLDQLITSPNPNWGTITNTSIEGGKTNPYTGIRGDWSGTPFQLIYDYFGDEDLAGRFYGKCVEEGHNRSTRRLDRNPIRSYLSPAGNHVAREDLLSRSRVKTPKACFVLT